MNFAFSEVVRKLANLVRIGKIVEISDDKVKVQIGDVTTGWIPIVSTAGSTMVFVPITIGEQVAVVSPYGECAQSFVIRSLHYNSFKAPENTEEISLDTSCDIRIDAKNSNINLDDLFLNLKKSDVKSEDFSISVGDATILINNGITLKNGDATISMNNNGITLSCGSSSIILSSNNISITSGSISTTPPICLCTGA